MSRLRRLKQVNFPNSLLLCTIAKLFTSADENFCGVDGNQLLSSALRSNSSVSNGKNQANSPNLQRSRSALRFHGRVLDKTDPSFRGTH